MGRTAETFGVERGVERCKDLDSNEHFPTRLIKIKSYYEDFSGAGTSYQTYGSYWLILAFERTLDPRCRVK